jgi:polyhydroxyalkanoate synthesis regulator phasin
MTEAKSDSSTAEKLTATWMKSFTDLWGGMMRVWLTPDDETSVEQASSMSTSKNVQVSLDAALKGWSAVSAAMTEPEALGSIFKGAGAMPEILAKLAQNTLGGYLQLQQKWLERAGRLGESTEAYTFTDIDENLFRAWTQMYEKEFRQFFRIPQLGLTRTYQEKINAAVDKYNIFQSTMAEFTRMLTLPLSRSVAVMQEKIGQLAEQGSLPEDSYKYYQMWIKILEGHYMILFQSPEYIQILDNTLTALSDFSSAKNAVLEDLLSVLPIPKRSEVDELEREIYELKKRLRNLEKRSNGKPAKGA